MEAGYPVHLANHAAMQHYAGLKYTNDDTDARWLAHRLRLGLLPTGYIYPKEERAVHARVKLRQAFQALLTVPSIGQTLALTIMLETGEIGRFPTVGQFASPCRCVKSTKLSNGKGKVQGHTKNGNN